MKHRPVKMTEAEVMPPVRCLNCGYDCDRASGIVDQQAPDQQRPEPGDFSLCINCGHLSAYADDLTLRPLTDAEILLAAGDPHIVAASTALAAVKERKQ
jgi:hypothetical protein